MDINYREYRRDDYLFCEALVNEAWSFDKLFESENLGKIAKKLYTKGSLVSSNFKTVAVCQEQVVGFIFAYNNQHKKDFLSAVQLGLEASFFLNFKKMDKNERNNFIETLKNHQLNRSKVVSKQSNEIVLFVVSPKYQGLGIGTQLWLGFKNFCSDTAGYTIQVETNKKGASSFYENLGFHHRVDFDSPLHNLATKGDQACIYEYTQ